MKTEIDARPSTGTTPDPFFAIRLYPESNREMAALEWAKTINYVPKEEFLRNCVGKDLHYAIIFQRNPKEKEGEQPRVKIDDGHPAPSDDLEPDPDSQGRESSSDSTGDVRLEKSDPVSPKDSFSYGPPDDSDTRSDNIALWQGRPLNDLPRAELVRALEKVGSELIDLRARTVDLEKGTRGILE